MKSDFVRELRCPTCQAELILLSYKCMAPGEVIDGLLRCSCGSSYLVHDGVPWMVPPARLPPAYAAAYRERLRADAPALLALDARPAASDFSFSWQWNEHAYNDLTWELRLKDRVELFYRYTGLNRETARGLRLLDAGCGNGTLSAELAREGMNVVALDLSEGPLRAYRYQLFNSRVGEDAASRLNYVHGDLQRPPFRDGQFDLIYSDGVLHHTPDTKQTFLAVARKVRPGGRLFVWLYRSDTRGAQSVKRAAVKAVRNATGWMSYGNRMRLCYATAFGMMLGVRTLHGFGWRGRPVIPVRQKAINLFDTITPTYNHEHTFTETRAWFDEAGFRDVRDVTISEFRLGAGGFAAIGTRGAA